MSSEFAGQTCGVYPRVSSRKQSKKDKTSLADQEQACRDYASELDMLVDEACVKPEAYTSTVMQRPELNLLLAEMKARHVRNLLIDRVDRMTRQGQIAAIGFLQQFTRAGITLHIVSMGENGLVVRDDKGVKDYLDAAYQAQQDNKQRARIIKRAKRSRAHAGHYLRGSRAPYGFRYVPCEWDAAGNVTDKRMEPDEQPFAERGFLTSFAPNPYAARKKMLELYASGFGCLNIAKILTREGVPTPAHLADPSSSTSSEWWAPVVRYLVINPLNEGVLTNFRHIASVGDPDERHDEEWTKIRAAPPDQHVIVTPKHGAPIPLMDASTAMRIALHREHRRMFTHPWAPSKHAAYALMSGGRASCVCGAPLYIASHVRRGKTYLYYVCSHAHALAASCAGLSLPVAVADEYAWQELLYRLLTFDANANDDNYLDVLAQHQMESDAQQTAFDTFSHLKAARAELQRQLEGLSADVGRAQTSVARAALIQQMDRLALDIADADKKIAAHERQTERVAQRRAVLTNYLVQYHRYLDALNNLDPENREHIPLMATIARNVGAHFTVSKYPNGEPHVEVELLITPAAAAPWFSNEEEQQLASLPLRAAAWLDDDARRSFANTKSSFSSTSQ